MMLEILRESYYLYFMLLHTHFGCIWFTLEEFSYSKLLPTMYQLGKEYMKRMQYFLKALKRKYRNGRV